MVVVDNGAVVVFSDVVWLDFLDARARKERVSPGDFACEIGDYCGQVATLLEGQSDIELDDRDPFSDYLVQDQGRMFALSSDEWLEFIASRVVDPSSDVSDFGSCLGPVGPNLDTLVGVPARILASGLRAALEAIEGSGLPYPAPLEEAA
ncbi:MAG: hypothetical protein ACRDRQ_26860 [Pseudonocardiaceae bacterium]